MKLTNNQLINSPINQYFFILSRKSCLKQSLHLSRELYKSHLFMQNKANFKNARINITACNRKGYEIYNPFSRPKNKAKQSQFKPNFRPKLALFFPILALLSPIFSIFLYLSAESVYSYRLFKYIKKQGIFQKITRGERKWIIEELSPA